MQPSSLQLNAAVGTGLLKYQKRAVIKLVFPGTTVHLIYPDAVRTEKLTSIVAARALHFTGKCEAAVHHGLSGKHFHLLRILEGTIDTCAHRTSATSRV